MLRQEIIEFNKIKIEFIRVTHSIADSCALAIYTEVGTIHTGDFKIDYTPIDGKVIDLRNSNLGNEGVLLLIKIAQMLKFLDIRHRKSIKKT